ncbi:MAG: PA2169 family four-helix-bundle protein [Beggiatoa sp.]|nr:PA2169 family four-helix-bundle protein [Beggiatoa sp.]
MHADDMNKLLRGELSAIETYQQALEKERADFGQAAEFQQLSSILRDHQQAVDRLKTEIQRTGGTPVEDSGAWGTWSKIVMATAKLFGDKAALKALKEGEESGLKDCEDMLQSGTVPSEVKPLIDNLAAQQQAHIRVLDGLLAKL